MKGRNDNLKKIPRIAIAKSMSLSTYICVKKQKTNKPASTCLIALNSISSTNVQPRFDEVVRV